MADPVLDYSFPPCVGPPDHEVAPGTGFCHRCGLVITPRKNKRRRVRKRLPHRAPEHRRGLPDEMRRLVDQYGFDLVEQVLYETPPRQE